MGSTYAQALVWIQGEGNRCSTRKRRAINIKVSLFKIKLENIIIVVIMHKYASNMQTGTWIRHITSSPFEITPIWNVTLKLHGDYPCERITTWQLQKPYTKGKNISPAPTPQQMPGLPVIAFDIRQGHAWSLTALLATPHHHLGPELHEEIKSTEQKESWNNLLIIREHFPPSVRDPLIKLKFEPLTSVRLQV
jgi:hypothetical protein